jgi:hypothetical protein
LLVLLRQMLSVLLGRLWTALLAARLLQLSLANQASPLSFVMRHLLVTQELLQLLQLLVLPRLVPVLSLLRQQLEVRGFVKLLLLLLVLAVLPGVRRRLPQQQP